MSDYTSTPGDGFGPEQPGADLKRAEIWQRALFMVLFAVLFGLAKAVLSVVVVVQFLIVLFTGSANTQLLRLGSSLSLYSYQVIRYLTFNTEAQPFPLSDWPVDESDDSPWFDDGADDRSERRESAQQPEPGDENLR